LCGGGNHHLVNAGCYCIVEHSVTVVIEAIIVKVNMRVYKWSHLPEIMPVITSIKATQLWTRIGVRHVNLLYLLHCLVWNFRINAVAVLF